ncbi:major facilitator superfamily transporter [Pyronema domesticum]|nr:major facilitator superfamily transporter [Pyronema domesticum]
MAIRDSEMKAAKKPTVDNLPTDIIVWSPDRDELMVLGALAVVSLIVALDATILVPVLPTISTALKGLSSDAFWTGTSYLLTSSIFQPFIGAVSDLFGRKAPLIASLDFTQLLGGRSIKGIGGGGILVMVQIIFADIVPLRFRPKWFGCVTAAWAVGTITGPLIGGVFAEKTSWRWVFYINFPFCGLGSVIKAASFRENMAKIDWFGGILFVAGFTSFLVALTWGGVQYEWNSWQPHLINDLSSLGAYLGAMILGMLLFGHLYYVSFWIEAVKGKGPIATGVALLPVTCGLVPSSIVVGKAITRFSSVRWAIWSEWTLTIEIHIWVLTLLILGLGFGLLLTSITAVCQAMADTNDVSFATALYTFSRILGMCIGVAIGGAAFQNKITTAPMDRKLPAAIAEEATVFVYEVKAMPMGPKKELFLEAYADGFKGVFIVFTAIAGIAWLAGFQHPDRSHDNQGPSESPASSSSCERIIVRSLCLVC